MNGNDFNFMKMLDVTAAGFLFMGGINYGLVALFDFDLIGWIFGSMSIVSKGVYIIFVALCSIYDAVILKKPLITAQSSSTRSRVPR